MGNQVANDMGEHVPILYHYALTSLRFNTNMKCTLMIRVDLFNLDSCDLVD